MKEPTQGINRCSRLHWAWGAKHPQANAAALRICRLPRIDYMYVAPHFVVKSGVHLSLKTQLNMSFVADEHAPECQTKIVNQPTAFNPEPIAVPAAEALLRHARHSPKKEL